MKRFRFQVSGYVEVQAEGPEDAQARMLQKPYNTPLGFTMCDQARQAFVFVVPVGTAEEVD